MNFRDYQEGALRTAPINRKDFTMFGDEEVPIATSSCDLDHGAIGIGTEAGELLDINKRYKYYGKEIDWLHVIEEAGDVLWYLALIARAANSSLEDIAARNLGKLKARYPHSFSNEAALTRDLEKERTALEEKGLVQTGGQVAREAIAERLVSHCADDGIPNAIFFVTHGTKIYQVSVKQQ